LNAPGGFTFSGLNAGIKPQRKDLALVFSETPCARRRLLHRQTAPKARGRCWTRKKRLPAAGVQAVIINSGKRQRAHRAGRPGGTWRRSARRPSKALGRGTAPRCSPPPPA